MDLGNGWNLPTAVLRKIVLLDYLADYRSETSFAPLPPGAEESGTDANQLAVQDLRNLQARGWVELSENYGDGVDTRLLGPGWAFIEDVRAKRHDRPSRYKAARDAVLHWLHDGYLAAGGFAPGINGFTRSPYGLFYGEPFSDDETNKATLWLAEREFLSGQKWLGGGIGRPSITAKGITMAESGRSVNNPDPIVPPSVSTHIIGDHNTVQAASPGASMVVTTTITDDHRRQSLDLAGAIQQAESGLAAEAAEAAVQLREAAQPGQDDPGVLRQALEKVQVTLMTGSADLLGKAILGSFAGLLAHYGIPLQG